MVYPDLLSVNQVAAKPGRAKGQGIADPAADPGCIARLAGRSAQEVAKRAVAVIFSSPCTRPTRRDLPSVLCQSVRPAMAVGTALIRPMATAASAAAPLELRPRTASAA